MAALQRNILSVVQAYVKPGGRLIFSTCTINRKENEENARWFLEHFPFDCISLEGKLGEGLDSAAANREFIQLLPGIHPCDGFFYCGISKKVEHRHTFTPGKAGWALPKSMGRIEEMDNG